MVINLCKYFFDIIHFKQINIDFESIQTRNKKNKDWEEKFCLFLFLTFINQYQIVEFDYFLDRQHKDYFQHQMINPLDT